MKLKSVLIISAVTILSGCTATEKFKGPNFTYDDLPSKNYKHCSEAHSVHSPIIWLPIVGPTLNLFLLPSPSDLTGYDAWQILPLIGPPITYIKGRQSCVYYALGAPTKFTTDNIKESEINEAIAVSDKNCASYQHILTAGFNELDANQKFVGDAATVTQTGAAFANPLAGAIIGGLKQTITSANDAIKTNFFVNFGAPQLFDNIAKVRSLLTSDLVTPTAAGQPSKWGFLPDTGMSFGEFKRFMTIYDKSCTFEQAINDLRLVTDQGQTKLTEKKPNPAAQINDQAEILKSNNANTLKVQ